MDTKGELWRCNTNYAVGFSIGSKGYIGTGMDTTSSISKCFFEYDPSNDTWTQMADFAGPGRRNAVGFSIGNKGYIGTGSGGTNLKDFWEYDPIANSWIQKADFGGAPRHYAAGFSVGGKGYIGTGDTSAGSGKYVKDFWEYDTLADTWTSIALFPGLGRGPGVGFSIGTKGYFGTGNVVITDLPSSDFWEYDPSINSWTQKANIPMGKCGATGFSLNGKGYIGTGTDSIPPTYSVSKSFYEYDPILNSWTQKADFGGTARKHAVAFFIGTKGYAGTGGSNDFWEYDPNGVGINEIKEEVEISICPNPIIENAVIQIKTTSANKNKSVDFVLYNLNGAKVRSLIIENSICKFERNGLPAGTYIYNVSSEKKVLLKGKLIVL